MNRRCGYAALLRGLCCPLSCLGAVFEIHPAVVQEDEEFERIANSLKPGDELVLQGGIYSQAGRRAITVQGMADPPVTIRAADGQEPVLTRPVTGNDRFNNIEFVDCTITGITAAPHAAVPHMRRVRIVNNTLVNHPVGVQIR